MSTNKELAALLVDALDNQDTDAIWFIVGELEKDRAPAYSKDLDLTSVTCSICNKFNLDEELCHSCKTSLECVNCCGCEN
jgi:hypothetical protein